MEPQQVPSLSRSRPDTGGRGASLSPASSVECRARNKGREAPFAFDCQSRRCRRCRCRWAQGREGRLRRRPKGAGGTPLSAVEVTRQVEVERKSERVRGWRAGVQEEPTWCCLVDDGWMDVGDFKCTCAGCRPVESAGPVESVSVRAGAAGSGHSPTSCAVTVRSSSLESERPVSAEALVAKRRSRDSSLRQAH